MESVVGKHLLADLRPARIFGSGSHEVQFAVRSGTKHLRKRILCGMGGSGRNGIKDRKHIRISQTGHLVPLREQRIFPMVEGIGDCDDGDSLSGIAEHLGTGHHYYIVIGILRNRRLERWLERLAERFAEVHAHVGEVFDNDGIILCGKLTDGPEFIFGKIEPCRIVRAGVYDCSYASSFEMPFKFRSEFFSTEVIYIEGVTRNTKNTGLGTLYREAGINKKDRIPSFDKMRTEKECREASLHRTHCRDAAERIHIDVKIGLEES